MQVSNDVLKKKIWQHLEETRKEEDLILYDDKDIQFKSLKGYKGSYRYGHILPIEIRNERIFGKEVSKYIFIKTFREDVINYLKSTERLGKKMHTLCNHLNSSQIVVFNFLIPIIMSEYELEFTDFVFGNEGHITIENSMSDSAGKESGTEVDFTITSTNNVLSLYECKYTEKQFDKTSRKEAYINKWNVTNDKYSHIEYKKIANYLKEDKQESALTLESNFYFDNYQLIRNLYNTFNYVEDNEIKSYRQTGTMNVVYTGDCKEQNVQFKNFKSSFVDEISEKINDFTWKEITNKAIKFFENKDVKYEEHYKLFGKIYLDYI